MINGGLGMLLATETGYMEPSTGQKVAYGAVAGTMWIVWVSASIVGERKRSLARRHVGAHAYKEEYD